jgi:putative ABC transport system substrate-binding protein
VIAAEARSKGDLEPAFNSLRAAGVRLAIVLRDNMFVSDQGTRPGSAANSARPCRRGNRVKRRELITLVGGAMAWPLAARAQQGERMRRIGVLMSLAETDPEAQARVAAFRKGLQTLGWAEGRNVRIDIRWAASDAALMQRFAKELIALQPDLILSHNTPTTASLLQQTRTIPIVFVIRFRSSRQRFRCELSATGRQRHRFHQYRADDGRQVAGAAQGDCAERCPGRVAVQPGNRALCGILPRPPQSRRRLLRSGGDRRTCSRQVRANILVLAIALVLCASSSNAQQPGKVFRVGILALPPANTMQQRLGVFREALRDLGYEEGRNLIVESRFADGVYDRLPVLAGELARLKVDVFLTPGEPVLLAAKEKGENIPIVAVTCDPLEKLLGSLRRPGGNATGFSCVSADLVGKRFSLLKSLLPRMERVAVFYNKRDNHELEFKDADAVAQSLGIGLVHFPVGSPADFEPAFKRIIEEKCDALYIVASTFANAHWEKLAQLALDYRLPAMYGFREFAYFGGLISYGANLSDGWRRAAAFVDKILKGSRPSDLPVEQPTRFELIINARTAKALGLDVPPTLIALADEVIE